MIDNGAIHNRYLVEKYTNGKDWYRIYSDGWIEQGGYVETSAVTTTINLLKSFTDVNYSISTTIHYGGSTYSANVAGTPATDNFQVYVPTIQQDFYWRACGY